MMWKRDRDIERALELLLYLGPGHGEDSRSLPNADSI